MQKKLLAALAIFALIAGVASIGDLAAQNPASGTQAPSTKANKKQDARGTFTVFSRKSGEDDAQKKDTVVLWTSTDIQENEKYESLVIFSGDVNFYGTAKDLVIVGGKVVLHDGSKVEDSLVVVGGKLVQKDGAHVTEQVFFELPEHLPSWIAALSPIASLVRSEGASFLKQIVIAVLICLFGALFYVIMPETLQRAEDSVQANPFESGLWSFFGILFFIPGLVMLVISVIGIIFIPLYGFIYFLLYGLIGYVMTANILGHFLPPRRSVVMPPLRMCYGVFILELVSVIPYVGPLAIYICSFLAAGAMMRTLFYAVRSRTSKSVAISS